MYKRLYLTGFAAYAVMLVLSVVFYKERIVLNDCAYNLFYIVKDRAFDIQHFRFGNVVNQVLPVLATKANLSLAIIMICYSLGFTLHYLICYLVCGSILKRYDFALLILLVNILFVSDTFYWIPSELPQGIAILMVLLAAISNRSAQAPKRSTYVLMAAVVFTLAFFHPLLVFPIGFVAGFFWLKNQVIGKRYLYLLLGIYFGSVLLKGVVFRTKYEAHSMSGLKNFVTQFPDYFTLYSNQQFLLHCLTLFYWIPVFFVGIVVYYIKTNERKMLWFFLLSFFGYLGLVNISYPNPVTPPFYIENLYLPLALFLGIPVVFDILPVLDAKKLAIPLFSLVVLTGCVRFYTTHNTYTTRLNWERDFLDKNRDKKLITGTTKNHAEILLMPWGSPYEFWLLSTSERNRSASIIIDDKPETRDWASGINNKFIVNWNIYPYEDLKGQYFKFTDTVSGYIVDKPAH